MRHLSLSVILVFISINIYSQDTLISDAKYPLQSITFPIENFGLPQQDSFSIEKSDEGYNLNFRGSIISRPDYYIIAEPAHMWFNAGQSFNHEEVILFDAEPAIRYSLWNSVASRYVCLIKNDDGGYVFEPWKYRGIASYAMFQPQIRMYHEESLPVKTPSYRGMLGTQMSWTSGWKPIYFDDATVTLAYETGHYSNGQQGCAYDSLYMDETVECNNKYKRIIGSKYLADSLNRQSGNFSTNKSELIAQMDFYKLRHSRIQARLMFQVKYMRYLDYFLGVPFDILNFGGHTIMDRQIYGRDHFRIMSEYYHDLGSNFGNLRFSINLAYGWIQGSHISVNPHRFVSTLLLYPASKDSKSYWLRFLNENVALMFRYATGHDNLNLRFLDSGSVFGIGLSFTAFPYSINWAN